MAIQSKKEDFRYRMHEIIFEADTPAGKFFDVSLLIVISLSVVVVMLDSVASYHNNYTELFNILEWIFTIYFTLEYIARLYVVDKPLGYARSFFGIIDLLAILPSYLAFFFPGGSHFIIIRVLRLFRIFRIFKLGHFLKESKFIMSSLRASSAKITVFLTFVLLLVMVIGSMMHIVEGATNDGFSSIPKSIYWAIVTLTTVGYGDITPQTNIGQFFSAIVMLLGYAIIAVPTGIVTQEFMRRDKDGEVLNTRSCKSCSAEGHDRDAVFCKYCGNRI